MKREILSFNTEYEILVNEINIENDEELSKKYSKKIPVLIYRGRMISKFRIDKTKFLRFCKYVQEK